MITQKQLTLADIFEDCQEIFESDKQLLSTKCFEILYYSSKREKVFKLQVDIAGKKKNYGKAILFLVCMVRRGIIGHDDLVFNLGTRSLFLQVTHKAYAVVVVCRNEYREHRIPL